MCPAAHHLAGLPRQKHFSMAGLSIFFGGFVGESGGADQGQSGGADIAET